MVFSSLVFLSLFLPVSIALYFISKNQAYRNWVLVITSLVFYAWGEPTWILLLIFTSFFDFFNGLIAESYRCRWQSKAALISSIVGNLSILVFFKYSGFIVENINYLWGTHFHFNSFNLPLGISFYTFQTLSYVIDVYRGEVPAQKSPLKLLLFVSLFHQLVAGPIVRYKDIAEEIENRVVLLTSFNEGIKRFVLGLGKKVILANPIGEAADIFLKGDFSQLSVLGAWYGIALFALQIYFDFSGYSDMAIGLGKMFGFTYKENFNYPYVSKSAGEFWRRWHISLGSFFKDYLYIPLGGNRKGYIRNLIIVWFLTGLWHGASWNFVLWGLYFGFLIIAEKVMLLRVFGKIPKLFSHVYLIAAILVGWVFFYYTDLSKAASFLQIMFGFGGKELVNSYFSIEFSNNVILFAISIIACMPVMKLVQEYASHTFKENNRISYVYNEAMSPVLNFGLLIISIAFLVGKSYNPFLYFRF